MNITPLHNPLINNSQEINNPNVASRWGSKITRIITPENCVRITADTLITAGSISSYMFLSEHYPITSLICVAISPFAIDIAGRLITCIYSSNLPENQETSDRSANLNNQQVRIITQIIRGNHGSFATKSKLKTRQLKISYNELTELPNNYHYNNSKVCNITLEPLEQGDTVCCDTHLYSFKALKLYYEKHMGNLIPHNRQPLDWNKVYQLSTYGIAPTS
jgi:hypothetical protein